MNVGHLHPD